jgi:GDP-4-dehydro-6-deoxy-D-mannose reductase
MTKIIVTGSDGFVGKHLIELLKKSKKDRIFGLDKSQADITKYPQVKKYLAKIKPDQVYHLAGFASGAGKDKDLIFKVNVQGTINILKALKEINRPVKILLASTAYVYGNTPKCALDNSKTDPKSFYDKSKISMEKEAKKYLKGNIQIVISRATNHIGPGQKLGFVVPDFCNQIISAKNQCLVGNLSAKRDIFDVRDCVKAYKLIMAKGNSSEIYNIGTGKVISIKEILKKLIKISGKKLSYRIDPKLRRPSDIAQNCVNPAKIKKLGWRPKISLGKSLKDAYQYYLTKTRM